VHDAAALTGLQLAVLHVLWEEGEATTHDVWSRVSAHRPLALTTIATVLSRLERKQVLEHRREGRQYVYWATVTRHDVRRSKIRELVETLFDGNPADLVGHVVEGNGIDADGMQRLRRLLEDAPR
jgi:predicted transcriptional regulator